MNGNGWLKVLFGAGPLGAIVAFLLLQSAGIIPSTAQEAKDEIKAHKATSETLQQAHLDALRQVIEQQKEAARLLKLRCLHEAQTDADRRSCLGDIQ